MEESYFKKYGGFPVITRIVSALYEKILKSPNLAQYFKSIDMRSQVNHMSRLTASLLGGPASYTPEQLKKSHADLNICQTDFDEMVGLMVETLNEFGFAPDDVADIRKLFEERAASIVTRD